MRSVAALMAILAGLALAGCGSGSPTTTSSTAAAGRSGAGEGAAGESGPPAAADPGPGTSSGSGSGSSSGSGSGAAGGGSGSAADNGSSGSGSRSKPGSGKVPGDAGARFRPRSHSDSGGGAGQFEAKGADNSIQEFGGETTGGEFAEAAAALHDYLDARAARAWAASCEYLAAGVAEQLSQLSGSSSGENKQPSCAEVIAGLSAGIPDSALREVAVADVGSLRAEGDRGFLLFKGAHGVAYFTPMAREGGEWKVAAIAPSALP